MQASHAILQLYWTSCSNPLTIKLNSETTPSPPVINPWSSSSVASALQVCFEAELCSCFTGSCPKIAAENWVHLLFAVELGHSKKPTMPDYALFFSAE